MGKGGADIVTQQKPGCSFRMEEWILGRIKGIDVDTRDREKGQIRITEEMGFFSCVSVSFPEME